MAANIQFIRIKIGEHIIDASMDDLRSLKDILDKLFVTTWIPTTYPPNIIPRAPETIPWPPQTWVISSSTTTTWPSGQDPFPEAVAIN